MKAYKITGKLGDICSFVGGNEVKKGDTVYFHSESDMKQQCVAKTQENDMSIEAMKQALEALDRCGSENYSLEREAIESLRQAIEQAEKQEPVAWLHTKIEGVAVPHRPADLDKHPDRWEALYRTPPPCPTCEALARTVMLDQTSHDNISPQRTWQGLTDEELKPLCDVNHIIFGAYTIDFVRSIEAKLKEKNSAT